MKSTGIVRRLDSAGRFVIPIELRRVLGINRLTDSLEIFVEDDKIILRKYSPSCMFCKTMDDVVEYSGHLICRSCIRKLSEKLNTEPQEVAPAPPEVSETPTE